jgi:hypothetical protein
MHTYIHAYLLSDSVMLFEEAQHQGAGFHQRIKYNNDYNCRYLKARESEEI